MVRIGISVEGTCEEIFVKNVLAPYLAEKCIYLSAINMGGDVKLDKVTSELKNIAYNFDFVTTLYDFYGFKNVDASETKESLERKMKEQVHTAVAQKLIPYVQLYEFEGLLFSNPESIGDVLNSPAVSDWANKIVDEFNGQPETINNSAQTAPSKRLEKNSRYRKIPHGPKIAAAVGIERMREQCPGFDNCIATLEGLIDRPI